MGPLSWLIFGALAGFVANAIMSGNERQGCFQNMILGVVGAFVGGLLVRVLGGRAVDFGWDIRSFFVAVLGAVVLIALFGRRKGKS